MTKTLTKQAWLLGVTLASIVYLTLSFLFPAKETILEEAIWGDEDEGTAGAGSFDEEVVKGEDLAKAGATVHVVHVG